MRVFNYAFFLTFVLSAFHSLGLAAPKKQQSVNSRDFQVAEEQDSADKNPVSRTESTQLAYPKGQGKTQIDSEESKSKLRAHKIRGKKDIGFHLGILNGDAQEISQNLSTQYYGITYIYNDHELSSWDFNLEVSAKNIVQLHYARRIYFEPDYIFKSYYKYGLSNFVSSSDLTAALINFRHFKVFGALGFADLFEKDRHIYSEIAAGYGQAGLVWWLHVGYAINF